MFECPYCKSVHFNLEEINFRPQSAPVYAIVCEAAECKKVIGLHEKGIYDILCEIKELLDKP